jgi:hypothetical protein
MTRKRNTIKDRIKEFQLKCTGPDPVKVTATVQNALGDRHCLLVKQAAELCEERLIFDLEADLLKAYQRFLKNPVKKDPNCTAKEAIVRALVALDSQEIDFFIAGLHYHQYEPVWGGSEDTAVGLRVSCATGLVNTSYSRALIELVTLLNDPSAPARKGAVRAITYTQPLAAEAVLRAKALSGDPDPDVTGETLSALLRVSPYESQAFVASFLESSTDPVLRQSIALAIGASKLDEALDILRSCWNRKPLKKAQDNFLLLGAILHRSEKAFDWLLEVIVHGEQTSAKFVVEELAIYKTDKKLRGRIDAAVVERADDGLTALFYETWRQREAQK